MVENLVPRDQLDIALRVSLAVIAGGAIGWNRYVTGKPAGIRTHMLVALGAALFVIPSLLASAGHGDPISRVIQGIAAGIGFLGAGEIFRQPSASPGSPPVRGLTTAAAIWVTAGIGILAACGLWQLVLFATAVTLIILTAARWLESDLPLHHRDQ